MYSFITHDYAFTFFRVSFQGWRWPTSIPACLLIRPPLQWNVSGNICWTWFLPAPSPKQQTHGNNAISPLLLMPQRLALLISITAMLIIILLFSIDSGSDGQDKNSFSRWSEVYLNLFSTPSYATLFLFRITSLMELFSSSFRDARNMS